LAQSQGQGFKENKEMKKIFVTIIIAIFISSCSDSINDLMDMVEAEVPICVIQGYVAANPDGRGWKNAVGDIQTAVNMAQRPGQEIWVKAGTYNISSSIIINKSVSISGGFNGSEQRSTERNIAANTTTIQPSGGISAFSISGFQRNIFFDSIKFTGTGKGLSIASSSVITVNNCNFNSLSSSTSGAAISINDSSVIFNNCNFTNNSSSSVGGAIYATSSTNAEIVISHCSFINNYANTNGGAISTYSATGNVKLTINNSSEFRTNLTSNSSGGAVYCGYGTSAYIYNSDFFSNGHVDTYPPYGASYGGAIYFYSNAYCIVSGCNFSGNDSSSYGGAISFNATPDAHIINSNFNNNTTAYMSGGGGAIGIFDSTSKVYISGSIFTSNLTIDSGSPRDGGAILCYLGLTSIDSCKFKSNTASNGSGGAIFVSNGAILSCINSLYYDNEAILSGVGSGNGGAIFIASGSGHSLVNLSFYSNIAGANGGAISLASSTTADLYNLVFYNNTVPTSTGKNIWSNLVNTLYYCFYNNGLDGSVTGGFGCINSTNLPFSGINDTDESTFLYPNSIIIDKGLSSAPGITATDLAGNPRIAGSAVDIGAYEAQ
jgi:predicted outer membrane repeat protein